MSTTIKVECIRDENTTDKQWREMGLFCNENFSGVYDDGEFITMDEINTSYRRAELKVQFADIKPMLRDSKITINLWYEEREPDEVLCLEVEE